MIVKGFAVDALDTRREIPGAEGYTIYGSVSDIIDALAGVFPVFLYLGAAAGIFAGHILLPKIVYNAYGKSFGIHIHHRLKNVDMLEALKSVE